MLSDGGFQVSRLRGKAVDPAWLTWDSGTVPRLTQAIAEEHAYDRLPILADALEEAGCSDTELLTHCRRGGEHAGTCWVTDLLVSQQ
ncbi:MAG: hypothetical protein K2R98_05495 [Gemmataceae bacterium]|nr:hypothetical protein [Gemmataceae bacterium]